MKTLKQHIRRLNKGQYQSLKKMCKHSNSLYNSALYEIKKHFEETGNYLGYFEIYKMFKNNFHYQNLPRKIGQQTLRLLDRNYRSFFGLLKLKQKGLYKEPVSPPKYRKKGAEFILILPNDQISLNQEKQVLKITKDLKLHFSHKIEGKIKQAIIIPKTKNYYEINISYEQEEKEKPELDKSNFLSIDLGVNNLISCFSNVGRSFIMSGKPLKSKNQFYNKRKAEIQSTLQKLNDKKWSNKLSRMNIKRNNYINNYLNQTIAILVKFCLKQNVGTIVLGYNEEWKQNVNIGKKNNQNFAHIPFAKLKDKLKHKCLENGIDFILQEESYTSKCSFLDDEPVKKQVKYKGKRVKRGLFRTAERRFVNADINGAGNILRKAFPDFKLKMNDGIEVFIVKPLKLRSIFDASAIQKLLNVE